MVHFLRERGAEVNLAGPTGETPLHAAAETNSASALRFLLSQHAWPNVLDNDGDTLLSIAPRKRRDENIEVLLEVHADPNLKSARRGPRCSTRDDGDAAIVDLLLACGADVNLATPDLWRRSIRSLRSIWPQSADPNRSPGC